MNRLSAVAFFAISLLFLGCTKNPPATSIPAPDAPEAAKSKPKAMNDQPLKTFSFKGKDADWVALSPDGKVVALATGTLGTPGDVRLWDVASGKERPPLPVGNWVRCVVFTADSKTLVSAGNRGTVQFWDLVTAKERSKYDFATIQLQSLAVTGDGKTFAFGHDGYKDKQEVIVVDASTLKEQYHFQHPKSVRALLFSKDGKTLASGCDDGVIRLWDLNTGKEKKALRGHQEAWISSLAFTPDEKMLYSGSWDWSVKAWNLASGSASKSFSADGYTVDSVAIIDQGNTMIMGSATVVFWSTADGKARSAFKPHASRGIHNSLSLSADGKTMATLGQKRSAGIEVKIWDVPAIMNAGR